MPLSTPAPPVPPRLPVPEAGRADPNHDPDVEERQCGRCRRYFEVIPPEVSVQEWWLCGVCREAIFGPPKAPVG